MTYALWIHFFIGFRNDHFFFIGFVGLLFFLSEITHKITLGFVFFIAFWLLYDSMRIYPNYMFNPVHVEEPYQIEKALFGIMHQGAVITPNEYFKIYQSQSLSFISGVFYLLWMPAPLAYAVYLYFKDKRMLLHFSFAFLLTNLFGFVVYYLYPAAPPWYVDLHGFKENFDIPGNSALLAHFDAIVGAPIFENIYNKNSNVFAAIPSLHAAYPVVLFYYGLKKRLKFGSVVFLIVLLGIWFAAVYSGHHYIIDVILGAICAIFAVLCFERLLLKTKLRQWFDNFAAYIH